MSSIIINADDYGLKKSCTLAIVESFKNNYISNTTMCANGYYFEEAVNLAFDNGFVGHIGIHLNVTEGKPLTDAIRCDEYFCDKEGFFRDTINRYKPLTNKQKSLLYDEFDAQIKRLRKFGISISHADSHHHIHTGIFIYPVVAKVLKANNINKLRPHRNVGRISVIKYVGKEIYNFVAKAICGFYLVDFFCDYQDLPFLQKKHYKTAELMVHPEYSINGDLINRTEYDNAPRGESMEKTFKFVINSICDYMVSYRGL